MDNRRKILFYINPETSDTDRCADAILEQSPKGDRGRLIRAAMIGGLALQKLDPRLPFLLTELMNSNTSLEEVLQQIRTIVQLHESPVPDAGATSSTMPDTSAAEPGDDAELTRKNARGMF